MNRLTQDIEQRLADAGLTPADAPLRALYAAAGAAVMDAAEDAWHIPAPGKTACYFSAEFLLGRLLESNLYNLGALDGVRQWLADAGRAPASFEEVDDPALGNGGLGRLAACFLDSAATGGLRLDGYGIRYKYGLFRQSFENGFQREAPDDWQRWGDPFSRRREDARVPVRFGDKTVWAVPYDTPVIGYRSGVVNNLRLWQAEAADPFDFDAFNRQDYAAAYAGQNAAEALHSLLYPADDTEEGKRLRLEQQYFFSSASVQSLWRGFAAAHGADWEKLPECYAVQLNDTHPTVAIPELLRLLCEAGLDFGHAFPIVQKTFAYTNHTIMAEALEKWDVKLFSQTLPAVWPYVVMLNDAVRREVKGRGFNPREAAAYALIDDNKVQMARMAVYAGHSVNGVAAIHTRLLETDVLADWYRLYPQRFNNKTNGVTPRRWLGLANPALAGLLDEWAGPGWVTDLDKLKAVARHAQDVPARAAFAEAKALKKRQLAACVQNRLGVTLDPGSLYDVQIKRLHEYKRQLLNAFSILELYFRLKDGALGDLPPLTFLFGGKAAPGYRRAKGIIKYINEVARLIDADPAARGRLQVLFVPDYNVSWAERLIPAADVSEQISTAGTEASGTGNMKLMMNGAVTLGTLDGANIEIVEAAGAENNYIFGATVDEIQAASAAYDPLALYRGSPRLRRVVDSLVDGTVDDGGTGLFAELHRSLLRGEAWHRADQYYLLLDFEPYLAAKLRAAADYADPDAFAKKALLNIAGAGPFSSDATVRRYAADIWGISSAPDANADHP